MKPWLLIGQLREKYGMKGCENHGMREFHTCDHNATLWHERRSREGPAMAAEAPFEKLQQARGGGGVSGAHHRFT